jgi:Na+-translocating ferredoxin:NAD+ oxidoreductase RnfD subunit
MKFNNKILIISFTAILILTAHHAYCSDNSAANLAQQVSQTTQSQQAPQNAEQSTQNQAVNEQSQTEQTPAAPPQSKGFAGNFANMLLALGKVLLLIFLIGGILVLYQKARTGQLSFKIPALNLPQSKLKQRKQKKAKDSDSSGEPADVSEAVSSFIRHRIKK